MPNRSGHPSPGPHLHLVFTQIHSLRKRLSKPIESLRKKWYTYGIAAGGADDLDLATV
jgi:hypothetical protein